MQYSYLLAALIASLLLASPTNAVAQSKVVVVPLLSDATPTPLKNIITVSAENGDFTKVEDALDSINDARDDNRYLIVIGPGNYLVERPLALKAFVHISGSGRNVTRLFPRVREPKPESRGSFILFQATPASDNHASSSFDNRESLNITISDLAIENQSSAENQLTSIVNTDLGNYILNFKSVDLYMNGAASSLLGIGNADSNKDLIFRNSSLFMDCGSCTSITGIRANFASLLTIDESSSIEIQRAGVDTGSTKIVGIDHEFGRLQMSDSRVRVLGDNSTAIVGGAGGTGYPGIKSKIERSTIRGTKMQPVSGNPSEGTSPGPGAAISYFLDSKVDPRGSYVISQSSIEGSVSATKDEAIRCSASDDNEGNDLDKQCQRIVPK